MMRKAYLAITLIFLLILNGCSLPQKTPKDGIWYNEELNVSFEFITQKETNCTDITNILWNSQPGILGIHLGYGGEFYFYYIDENGFEIFLLEGHFKYSNDQFIVTASKLAVPFDISGTIEDVKQQAFIFTRFTENSALLNGAELSL